MESKLYVTSVFWVDCYGYKIQVNNDQFALQKNPLYCSGNSVVWNTTQSVNSFLWSFHWLINRKSMHMYALSDVTQKESMMPLLGLVTGL